MEDNILNLTQKIEKKRQKRKIWKNIFTSLAVIVVFCTTYALILPAITKSRTSYCGFESHAHEAACYKDQLICTLEEDVPIADPEVEYHSHEEACYRTKTDLICTIDSKEVHLHSSECKKIESVKICDLEENEEHAHTEECFTEQESIICGKEEVAEGHIHEEECYHTEAVLICEKEEILLPEGHVHEDGCYEQKLICEKEEHEHVLMCYSNRKADLETKDDWEATVPKELTGVWADDLLAVAKSQLGYKESIENYIVADDDETKGYTRYGDWYGDAYGDWCAMFISFCMNYAQIPENALGYEANCQNWVEKLQERDEKAELVATMAESTDTESAAPHTFYQYAGTYIPKPGDLVFFEVSKDNWANHVGIVTEAVLTEDSEEESLGQIKTIEGNASDAVSERTYKLEDTSILGYGVLPENPDALPTMEDSEDKSADTETTEVGKTEETTVEIITEKNPLDELHEKGEIKAIIYTDDTYEVEADDTTEILIQGILPINGRVKAYPVEVIAEGRVVHCAYDITIFYDDGNIFEPDETNPLTVSITSEKLTSELSENVSPEVFHVPNEGEMEFVGGEVTENGITFEAEHFSVYAVTTVAEGGGELIPTPPSDYPKAYYHSTLYPHWQVSPHRLDYNRQKQYWMELYILVPMGEYGGKVWVPNSKDWTIDGNQNYEVVYCGDWTAPQKNTGDVIYKTKKELSTIFENDQTKQTKVQFVIENAYPFITEAEMQERMSNAGYTGKITAAEMITGTQRVLWEVIDEIPTNLYRYYENADVSKFSYPVLNPLSGKGPGTSDDVAKVYDYLLGGKSGFETLEIISSEIVSNADGSYTVLATLNRPIKAGETITATLSHGSKAVTKALLEGEEQFSINWEESLSENDQMTLSIDGTYVSVKAYYYDDEATKNQGGYQNFIGGDPILKEVHNSVVINPFVNITVEKKWEGVSSSSQNAVMVYLLKNGERFGDAITLSESNKWTYTWKNLVKAENGVQNQYSVEEVIPEGFYYSLDIEEQDDQIAITITNTAIAEDKKTSVAVEKIWDDGNKDHSADSVTICLYADGKVTGKELVLNSSNGWKGSFNQLPYYASDGVTPIEYTVKENKVEGYDSVVSETVTVEGVEAIIWKEKTSLSSGEKYHFSEGGYALAVNENGALASVQVNLNDPYQLWTVKESSGGYTLYNEKTGKYVGFNISERKLVASTSSAKLKLSGTKLYYDGMLGSYYMQLTSNSVKTVTNSGSGTGFKIQQENKILCKPTYSITVTNTSIPEYELPETGGFGSAPIAILGIVTFLAVSIFLLYGEEIKMRR